MATTAADRDGSCAVGPVSSSSPGSTPSQEAQELTILACTWNMGFKDVLSPQASPGPGDFAWLLELCLESKPDLVALGFQEVHPQFLVSFREAVAAVLDRWPGPGRFVLRFCEAPNSYAPLLLFERQAEGGDGGGGETAVELDCLEFSLDKEQVCNKGCTVARLTRAGVDLCLVNAHLEAGHGRLAQRNDMQGRLEARYESTPSSLLLEMGDLNYRIEGDSSSADLLEPTKARPVGCASFDTHFERLVNICEAGAAAAELWPVRCQLCNAQSSGAAFQAFEEAPIEFHPTYRRAACDNVPVPGRDESLLPRYDREHRRLPGWCDRILWRRGELISVAASLYSAVESAAFSDHRPVHVVLKVHRRAESKEAKQEESRKET